MYTLKPTFKKYYSRENRKFFLALLMTIFAFYTSNAQDSTATAKTPKDSTYYVEPGTYGTKRDLTPPEYVRTLNKTGIKGVENIDWLDVGLDSRTRFEYRQDDIRRKRLTTDYPILNRERAYIGVKNILDPFRFAFELQNSFRSNSKFTRDTRDYNYVEPISAYVELHFKKALGEDPLGNARPAYIRFGRQNFEFLDRRLIASNQWRNTTNTFTGFRAALGQDKNDWQVDLLALRPLVRIIDKLDTLDKNTEFGAIIGHWRKWSEIVTLEPYGLYLRQRAAPQNQDRSRRIYNAGLRAYGWLNKHLNFDVVYNRQFGFDNSDEAQRAYAITAEVGYKFSNSGWKPRLSLFYGFVSGDKDPNDDVNNRFERFYGFARPWSADDYVIMENIMAPKIRIEMEPTKNIKFDAGYGFYWLASRTDRFNNLLNQNPDLNRDKTGESGKYLGHGPDARIRFKVIKFIDATVGYSHYFNGTFVKNRQDVAFDRHDAGSNFAYVEALVNIFDIFKKY